jgi:hypothetical protein
MPKDSNLSQPGGGAPRSSGGIGGSGGQNVQPVYRELSPSAKNSIAEARAAMGAKKATAEEFARRMAKEKANEIARIRNQGRNTR